MKKPLRLILAMLLTSSLWAQQPQATSSQDAPATREDVLKLFDTLRIREQMERVREMTQSQMLASVTQLIHKQMPQASPEARARFDALLKETMQETKDLYPVSEMLDDMIPTYQKHLSHGDIQAIIAFYQSPVGEKLLREQPAMSQEAMQVINAKLQPRLEQVMGRIMARTEKVVQDTVREMEKRNSQVPPPSPSPPKD